MFDHGKPRISIDQRGAQVLFFAVRHVGFENRLLCQIGADHADAGTDRSGEHSHGDLLTRPIATSADLAMMSDCVLVSLTHDDRASLPYSSKPANILSTGIGLLTTSRRRGKRRSAVPCCGRFSAWQVATQAPA